MTAAQLDQLAGDAFDRYSMECAALPNPQMQFDLFDASVERIREWRAIWLACEAEAIRACA